MRVNLNSLKEANVHCSLLFVVLYNVLIREIIDKDSDGIQTFYS